MNRKSKFTAETQRHKGKSQFKPFKLFKPIKPLLKSLCLSASVAFSMLLLLADTVNAKECILMEPEVLKKFIANRMIYNFVIFDVRPQFDVKMKYIEGATPAPLVDIEKEFVGKVDELIGKDVIIVGANTESAESVCRYMMKKDYGIRNIYVLKGGMEKWDGPVREDFSNIECDMITSRELINRIKSNKKVEIIDKRTADEYHQGHIPTAILKDSKDRNPSLKSRLQKREMRIKREQENITVVYVYPNEFQAIRDCRYEKYFSYGDKKNIYVLRGGMKVWEGEVEKDYLEILKGKVKERLK